MEEQNNSDSDSSETWTVIDRNDFPPDYGNLEYDINKSDGATNQEKIQNEDDTDTDGGIAVISDEETEVTTTTPNIPDTRESRLNDGDWPSIRLRALSGFGEISNMTNKDDEMERNSTSTIRESEQELSEEFFLSDYKIKSYVHRKNDKMSSLLNGVLLSTVMITIILAVGYLWGTTDDCSLSTIKSVSQILSNMQKLQLENDMLKSKIIHLLSVQNQRPSAESVVLSDHENFFKAAKKRRSNYYQNNLKESHQMKSADYDSTMFDSKFGLKYPSIDSFNVNHGLFSNFENQTSPEAEVHKTVSNKNSANNISKAGKYLKNFEREHSRPDCLKNSVNVDISLFGPKKYCESAINHKPLKNGKQHKIPPNLASAKVKKPKENELNDTESNVYSDSIRSEKKQKYLKKNKVLKKFDKKQSKVNKFKKGSPETGNYSEKIKQPHLNKNKVNSDWYQKMSSAREEFRKWHQYADEINNRKIKEVNSDWYEKLSSAREEFRKWHQYANEINHRKIKDKSNWYFRRMRERESIRFNSDV